jgi:hypothetical protein
LKSIKQDCEKPIVFGYLDTALFFNFSDVNFAANAINYRQKTAVTIKTGAKPFAIYNPANIPFQGVQEEAVFDGIRPAYNKTVTFTVPMRGANASKDVIEPILKNREGFVVILACKDKVGDGSFPIIGSESGAVCTVQTRNNSDKAQGGEWQITLVEESVPSGEITLFDTDYETSLAEFDRVLALVVD